MTQETIILQQEGSETIELFQARVNTLINSKIITPNTSFIQSIGTNFGGVVICLSFITT